MCTKLKDGVVWFVTQSAVQTSTSFIVEKWLLYRVAQHTPRVHNSYCYLCFINSAEKLCSAAAAAVQHQRNAIKT